MEIVIASHNMHKVREYRELLKPFKNLTPLSLSNFPQYKLPEETGSTFEENARIKATDAAVQLKHWVLADDSGLVVPLLQGKPGVHSSRFAGEGASDLDNNKKLLAMMAQLTGLERSAYFECTIAISSPEGILNVFSGICEGEIVDEMRGRHGFGYDPLFLKYDYDKTFGELDSSVKNRISHRYKAFSKLAIFLESQSLCTTR